MGVGVGGVGVKLVSCTVFHSKKIVCPTKNEPQQQGISFLEREREGVREREDWAGSSAGRLI